MEETCLFRALTDTPEDREILGCLPIRSSGYVNLFLGPLSFPKPAVHAQYQVFTSLLTNYNSAHSVEPCEIYYLANNLQIITSIPNVICIRQNCLDTLSWIGIPLCSENISPINSSTMEQTLAYLQMQQWISFQPHFFLKSPTLPSKYSAKSHFLSWPHGKREHRNQGEQEIPLKFQLQSFLWTGGTKWGRDRGR